MIAALPSTSASPARDWRLSGSSPSRNDATMPAAYMPDAYTTSRPSTNDSPAASSHRSAGAANG